MASLNCLSAAEALQRDPWRQHSTRVPHTPVTGASAATQTAPTRAVAPPYPLQSASNTPYVMLRPPERASRLADAAPAAPVPTLVQVANFYASVEWFRCIVRQIRDVRDGMSDG